MSNSRLRDDAFQIFQAGLDAVEPVAAVGRHLRLEGDVLHIGADTYQLPETGEIYLVGMGKASAAMAQPLVGLLGDRISDGVINVKYGHGRPLERVRVKEGGHPVPDKAGEAGTGEIIRLLEGAGPRDLVICLISGGGSALSPSPAQGLTLEDKQDVTRRLLACGATIHEINTLRKHLSGVKGGRLARLAYPASLVSFILSDVIGDDLDTIASGPTVPDGSTFADGLRILDRYGIRDAIPPSVLHHLEAGARGEIPETPKADDPVFVNTRNVIVGSNAMAVEAARGRAAELGYHALVLSSFLSGETREVAGVHAAIAREILTRGNPVPRPACVISGGETTVTIRGEGKGGRNQEFALAAALGIDGLEGVLILSAGTDGTDGPTDAAGAVADGRTVGRGSDIGLDAEEHLTANDSYNFFQPLGDLLVTGPTLTNVMDLRLVMVA